MKLKYYLADLLTFARIILAIALIILALASAPPELGFLVFILGELTDAFDGTLATKFPFPKNKTPKYRKYAAKYDMFADGLLAFAMMLFFTLRVSACTGIAIFIAYPLLATLLEFIIYGKFMGHPDDCTKNSLIRRNFPLAKRLVMIRRTIYLSLVALVAVWTFYSADLPLPVKITITVIALIICIFLWFFLSQRRHHISRDAVNIEEKLDKKKKV